MMDTKSGPDVTTSRDGLNGVSDRKEGGFKVWASFPVCLVAVPRHARATSLGKANFLT